VQDILKQNKMLVDIVCDLEKFLMEREENFNVDGSEVKVYYILNGYFLFKRGEFLKY
jgi:hypothetical protein